MENEASSKNTSTSSISGDSKSSSIGGFKYIRKVSTSFMRNPKKSASMFRKSREDRKSISVDDVNSLMDEENTTDLPKFSLKVRSLPRDGQIRSASIYSESISPARSDVLLLQDSNFSNSEQILSNKPRSYSITYDHFNYINSLPSNKEEPSSELKAIKENLAQSKKDFHELRANFELFKKEFHDGIESLTALVKEDENRYTKLCYQLSNVTDLHQTQLQYLYSLIDNMEEDNNKRQDDMVLDVLCEKLSMLETRILKL